MEGPEAPNFSAEGKKESDPGQKSHRSNCYFLRLHLYSCIKPPLLGARGLLSAEREAISCVKGGHGKDGLSSPVGGRWTSAKYVGEGKKEKGVKYLRMA